VDNEARAKKTKELFKKHYHNIMKMNQDYIALMVEKEGLSTEYFSAARAIYSEALSCVILQEIAHQYPTALLNIENYRQLVSGKIQVFSAEIIQFMAEKEGGRVTLTKTII
jgi:hypothetical protein